ncbi:nitroreductase [Microbacterium testaceum]|jgi:nitroreductase|uniref:Nitroreductase family protein n=1 Tax=Microbacterium algihabitans TaxID=3075992 RepID=A0ABU3RVN3_9MICO|nr:MULTISPECIES: nitroreductase family protein [Microbacterium]MCD2168141.1 nitroreductase family protein [Microbacterium sp. JC 701]MCM3503217.1 nitroreductase family protein [Microbacterium sp. P26]MDQ1172023.1 nitroreductase [Microbacterium testaceum]MDU0326513.1 nitroreductase family protein [Microbacterium sp. KSW2-21]
MSLVLDRTAPTDAPILDVLAERWSTRVFDAETPIDEEALRSALEAARWTPTGMNHQPWRMILARRGGEAHAKVVSALMGFNQAWAPAAGALLVVLAENETAEGDARPWALYDAGQAAAHFTVQAHAEGLATHQMGGFVADDLRAAFDIDPRFTPVTVIAVGALGDIDAAEEGLRQRELAPRERRTVAESLLVDA